MIFSNPLAKRGRLAQCWIFTYETSIESARPVFESPAPGHATLVRITREESQWKSQPVHVAHASWDFFHTQPVRLEVCAQVAPIDYLWGRPETVRLTV